MHHRCLTPRSAGESPGGNHREAAVPVPIPAWHLGGHTAVSPRAGSLGQILCTQAGFIQAFSLQDR